MPTSFTFSTPINVSCQEGDIAYIVAKTDDQNNSRFSVNTGNIQKVGPISAIAGTFTNPIIHIEHNIITPTSGNHFVLFSKDNKANLSSILGYYAEVKFKTNSTIYNELFSVGADVFESSK